MRVDGEWDRIDAPAAPGRRRQCWSHHRRRAERSGCPARRPSPPLPSPTSCGTRGPPVVPAAGGVGPQVLRRHGGTGYRRRPPVSPGNGEVAHEPGARRAEKGDRAMTLEDRLRHTGYPGDSTRSGRWLGPDPVPSRPGGSTPRGLRGRRASRWRWWRCRSPVSLAGDEPSGRVVTGAAGEGPATTGGPPTGSGTSPPSPARPSDGRARRRPGVLERFSPPVGRDWMAPSRIRHGSHRRSAEPGRHSSAPQPACRPLHRFRRLEQPPDRARSLLPGPTSRPAPTGKRRQPDAAAGWRWAVARSESGGAGQSTIADSDRRHRLGDRHP